jgi:hypothetical protein
MMAKWLVKHHANVYALALDSSSALSHAIDFGSLEMVKFLIEDGKACRHALMRVGPDSQGRMSNIFRCLSRIAQLKRHAESLVKYLQSVESLHSKTQTTTLADNAALICRSI